MAEEQKTQISLQDISFVVAIIDACVKRGAFEGSEIAQIGQIRDKLAKFVSENAPKEEVKEEETATAE